MILHTLERHNQPISLLVARARYHPHHHSSPTPRSSALGITVNNVVNLGKDLQRNLSWSLQAPVTTVGGLDVTLTNIDTAQVLTPVKIGTLVAAYVVIHVSQNQTTMTVTVMGRAKNVTVI